MLSGHSPAPMPSMVSSSSMLGSVDDSDGSDGEAAMFRPSKKLQLSTIAHLTLPASGCSTPRPSQSQSPKVKAFLYYFQVFYAMPTGWYEQWEAYCSFPRSRYPPGPIEMGNLQTLMKAGKAVEHRDYVVIPEEAWSLLVEWYGVNGEAMTSPHAPSWEDQLQIGYEIGGVENSLALPLNATIAHLLGTLVKVALQQGCKNPGDWQIYAGSTPLGLLADQIGERQVSELGTHLIMIHQ